jgi:23S rRNA pseudouridine2604 synthase
MTTRINKYLSEAGVTSRRGGDAAVEAGRVTIDGRAAVLGDTVEPGQRVELDGKLVRPRTEKWYVLFHKPIGVITTTDPAAHDTILDAIVRAGWPLTEKRVFPVGRLDVASSGLLLLTNDSEVGERMLRKEGGHEKEYVVTLDRHPTEEAVLAWREGMEILGQTTLPAKVRKLGQGRVSITLVQGLNRQVRRMCEAFGYEVRALQRVRIMHMHLGSLRPGELRELSPSEVRELRKRVGLRECAAGE